MYDNKKKLLVEFCFAYLVYNIKIASRNSRQYCFAVFTSFKIDKKQTREIFFNECVFYVKIYGNFENSTRFKYSIWLLFFNLPIFFIFSSVFVFKFIYYFASTSEEVKYRNGYLVYNAIFVDYLVLLLKVFGYFFV